MGMRRAAAAVLVLAVLASCGKAEAPVPVLPLVELGAFEYREKMKLGSEVTSWSGKRVRATGFMNPTSQARNLTTFLLVKDRASCCFGKRPQINHYVEVALKPGQKADYTTDPVTVEGDFAVDDRWDGDWQLGLYWMTGAEVRK
jgi:hypothetical protein